jgi:hypothetical protein
LRKATALTNAGRIAEATAEIQRFLNRQPHVMQDPAYGSAERTHIGGRARWTNIPAPTARWCVATPGRWLAGARAER